MPKQAAPKRSVNSVGLVREQITLDGKKYDLRAKTDAALDKKILDLRIRHANGNLEKENMPTVRQWTDLWLELYKKDNVDEKTYSNYEINVRLHVLPKIGDMPICDVSSDHLQLVLNAMKGKSRSNVEKVRYTLSQIFERASIKYNIKNPALKLSMPKLADETERYILTDEEQDFFVKTAKEHRAGVYALFMLCCGLRKQEVIPLEASDIDFEKQEISITKAIRYIKEKPELKKPKTRNSIRTIPIPNVLFDMLQKYKGKDGLLFIPPQSKKYKYYKHEQADRLFDSFLRAMDIKAGAELYRNKIINPKIAHRFTETDDGERFIYKITPHTLRHTYATNLYKYGVDLKTAQLLLGHADIKTTANIYTHEDKKKKREAAIALKNIYNS